MTPTALRFENIDVRFGGVAALSGVSLAVAAGEILAVVGPSGSGKSALIRTALGLVEGHPGFVGGEVQHVFPDGRALRLRPGRRVGRRDRLRLARRALVLQSGAAALEAGRPVGGLLDEVVGRRRPDLDRQTQRGLTDALLLELGLEASIRDRKVRELSGGMAQRVMLALALVGEPDFLFLDEPLTGVDVLLQADFLDRLAQRHRHRPFGAVLVTHDPGIARAVADRVAHLRDGRLVEVAPAETLRPRARLRQTSAGGAEASGPALRFERVYQRFGQVSVLEGLEFDVGAREVVGVVGSSGSGKTTLGRLACGLERATSGQVHVFDEPSRGPRTEVRMAYQNGAMSLNPDQKVLDAVREGGLDDEAAEALLLELGLGSEVCERRVRELSGGQRQRVSLARALAAPARLLVLDEPTSGLDAYHRERVVELLAARRKKGQAMVVISHDLGVVRAFADRVLILAEGRIAETLSPRQLIPGGPTTELGQALLEAAERVRGTPIVEREFE